MQSNVVPYFSEILNDAMYKEKKANRRLVEGIEDKVNCTMRNVQRYRTGEQVPNYITARIILDFLNIDINEEDLREILITSKKRSKELRSSTKTPSKMLYINSSNIDIGIDIGAIGIEEVINDRLKELYGDSGSLKIYWRTNTKRFKWSHFIEEIINYE